MGGEDQSKLPVTRLVNPSFTDTEYWTIDGLERTILLPPRSVIDITHRHGAFRLPIIPDQITFETSVGPKLAWSVKSTAEPGTKTPEQLPPTFLENIIPGAPSTGYKVEYKDPDGLHTHKFEIFGKSTLSISDKIGLKEAPDIIEIHTPTVHPALTESPVLPKADDRQ